MIGRKAHVCSNWRHWHTAVPALKGMSTAQRDERHPHLCLAEPECQVARTSKKRIFEERKEYLSAGGHQTHSVEQDDDALTVASSDDSGASIFGLRGRIHASDGEWSDGDESLISDDNEDVDAQAEKDAVAKWRQTQLLDNDRDFAFVYINFEEAYLDAGRPVAMAWSRCRQKTEFA